MAEIGFSGAGRHGQGVRTIKHRPPPSPPSFSVPREKLATDPQARAWIRRLGQNPDAKPSDLSRDTLAFVTREVQARRTTSAYDRAFEREMVRLTPAIAAPDQDDPLEDLALLFTLPEMQRFWHEWHPSSGGRSGPKPDYSGAKGVMCALAMNGVSAFAEDNYNEISRDKPILEAFESLNELGYDRAIPRLPGLGPRPRPITMPSYATVMRHLGPLAERALEIVPKVRMELFLSLREHVRDAGRWGMIDGTDLPAWAPQRRARRDDPSAEARLRAHTPEAGFRAYVRKGTAKLPLGADGVSAGALRANIVKSWRGYYLVILADLATGLPMMISVFDATHDEAKALVPLLSDLYRHAPDIPLESIAGDSAWDEDWACKTCLVDYGIHPIFRLHNPPGKRQIASRHSRDGAISGLSPQGQLICAKHGNPLDHAGLEMPKRNGLEHGKSAPENRFRVRAICPDGCGKTGLRCEADWSQLLHHPHFLAGRPDLHAHREARLATLSDIEALMNRYKSGRKLATRGGDRTRVRDISVVTALCELAALSFVAMAVHDVRSQHGTPLHLAQTASTKQHSGRSTADAQAA